jgi:hypothetical protein
MSIDSRHVAACSIAASMASRLRSVTGHSLGSLGFGAARASEAKSAANVSKPTQCESAQESGLRVIAQTSLWACFQ